jgi:hypothetical protein
VNNTDGLYFPAVSVGTTLYNYTLSTDNNTITFNSALPQGAVVFCERRTRDASGTYTTFASGSTIRATDLNNSSTESNFTAQDGRNKALETEGVLFRGDQPSTNFVTTDHIVAGTIVRGDIANDAIDGTKIADDSIDSEHYVDQSVDTQHIANANITTAKIDNSAVTTPKIADLNVTTAKLANGAVTNVKLGDNSVITAKIADGQVTHNKLANDSVDGDNIQDDVVNSEHIAAGALDNEHYAAGSITSDKLNGATVITAAEQGAATTNDTSFLTSAAADARFFNISSGDTIKDGQTFPDNDTTIATTAAINDRIIDIVNDVGGFDIIESEQHFPNSNPQGQAGSAAVLSIKAASGALTPSGTTLTITNGNLANNANITITGVTSTIPAGFGFIVESTATLHTYTFHRLVPNATEVTTVAGISGNVTTVAGIAANTTTVAGISANVTTVAGISSNVTSVAGNASNINAVAGNATNINAVQSNASNINTVAGSISNVNTAASNIASINNASANISSVNNFGDTYQIASSNPSTDGGGNALAEGDLYFNTTANELKVYNGSQWQGGVTASGNFAAITGNTFTGDNVYQDNAKLKLGTGSDLEIFHNSTDSIINDAGQGNLKIQSGGNTKVEVTSSGASVTGNITVSGTVDGRDIAADGTSLDSIEQGNIGTNVTNGNVKLTPNGTGVAEVRGVGGADGTLQLNCSQNSHGIKLKSPAHSAGQSYTLTFPTSLTANGVLTTNGSGTLSAALLATANIADSAVTTAKLNTDAVTTAKIADDAVTAAKIADNAVVDSAIQNGAVTSAKIANNNVGSQHIANGEVGTTELADQAVTLAKLEHGTSSNDGKFLRANNGADPTFETVNTDLVADTSPQLGGDLDTNSHEIKLDDDHHVIFGDDDDLKIKHSGSNGNINNYTGDLVIRTLGSGDDIFIDSNDDVSIRTHATDNAIKCIGDGGVELYHDSVKKLETQSDGVRFLDSDSNLKLQLDTTSGTQGIIYADSNQLQLQTGGGETSVKCIKDGATELYHNNDKKLETQADGVLVTGKIQPTSHIYQDDDRKHYFGSNQDLTIYHKSSDNNSYIEESGSGSLVVKADDFYVQNAGANHTQLISDSDADVKLSFNGTEKFQTTTDGAKVMGTGNFVLPSGTTAQRGSAATGAIRYNTTTSQLEVYNGTAWAGVGASSPQIYKVTNTTTTGAAGTSMVITGEDFVSGATVHYMGGDGTSVAAGSVSFNSSTQLTAVSPALLVAGAPYSIKVTNPDGGEAVAAPEVEVSAGNAPTWTTASGQIGSNQVKNVAVSGLSVAASDADGQAITYSETTSVLTSNANTPAATMNLSLNSSTGAITGTAPNVTSDTTYNFTLRATDTAGNTTDRNFNIVVLAAPAAIYWFAGSGYGSTGTRSGTTWSHTGYNPNASGGGNANSNRLRVYGNGTGGTYAGFHHFLYSNAITIPTGHDRCQIYISSIYTNVNGYRYNQGNGWTTSQPSGNSHGSGAFGARNMGSHGSGLQTYDVPSTHQGVTRYFQMFVFGGQNGVQYQEITLIKTYNQNNP